MSDVRVELAHQGAIARLIVSRPKGNIYTTAVVRALAQTHARALQDPHCKLITLEGEGPHFSFGAAVEEHTHDQIGDALVALRRLVLQIAGSPLPVAALVQGCCLGGAFEVVLACHFVLAAPDAKMGLPEIKLGVFPPVAAVLLPRKLTQTVADRMILTGEQVEGEELRALGFVLRCVPAEQLFAGAQAWFQETLAGLSASSLRLATLQTRRHLLHNLDLRMQEAERAYLDELLPTHDANEGIEAFLQRRPPRWTDA
jgi:cyclohexa-1,5-dienecarbonyl-CoA hydratase